MRVLIACEFSGVVRDSFRRQGHDAVSCDVLPVGYLGTNMGPHIQDDVLNHLNGNWDIMIAHPPCTDIAVSGAAWFKEKIADGRQQKALDFVQQLMDAPIRRICIENPISVISTHIRKPDQIIHPWQFGHDISKTTCLWLKNLPPLSTTRLVKRPKGERYSNQTPAGQDRRGPSPTRGLMRSIFLRGIADAMASQWGRL